MLRLEFQADRIEHVVFNPNEIDIAADLVKTKEPYAYFSFAED